MKKITLLLLLTMPVIAGFSQSAKLVNAINYLRDFQKNKDQESLTKAKENIDQVAQNPESKDPAKVQKVKGEVYLASFENALALQTAKQTATDPNEKAAAAYVATPAQDLDVSYQAFSTAKTLDTKKSYVLEIEVGLNSLTTHYTNKGVFEYGAEKLPEALKSFDKAYEIGGKTDTLLLSNIGVVAEHVKDYEKAKTVYLQMAQTKQGLANTYVVLANIYKELKDPNGQIDILRKGRVIYPNDVNLMSLETDYFLSNNKSEEALVNINKVIAVKPQEANLYLVRGTIYDKLANPVDATGEDLPKPADYEAKLKSAEADYKKGIELAEPDKKLTDVNFQTLFSLGVLYFNHGAYLTKVADKITDNAKFAVANKNANAEITKAMDPLEKASQLKPDDVPTLKALKQIYQRLELADKLKGINDKLKK